MPSERLNRYLARSGVASRRAADQLVAEGRVHVNDLLPPPSGMLVDPARDRVTLDGELVAPRRGHRYLACHKPANVLVTARDPGGRRTVFDLLPEEARQGRLFPVGRLDMDSAGLLLLTDDGQLAQRLAHPRYKVAKEYVVIVAGRPDGRDLRRLRQGVDLEDGRTQPAQVDLVASAQGVSELRVVISEGRNRQVRRMLDAVGHPVHELTRTAFGPIRLARLRPGHVRSLRAPELTSLRRAAGLEGPPGSPPRGQGAGGSHEGGGPRPAGSGGGRLGGHPPVRRRS
ncbi:MAG: rRNA pseudouridine synthase [Candidatus Dormibacteraeota bacterium]|nr:rRNA pseudouridine synthase [Candidatus Dormibacteraeota bacterium]